MMFTISSLPYCLNVLSLCVVFLTSATPVKLKSPLLHIGVGGFATPIKIFYSIALGQSRGVAI